MSPPPTSNFLSGGGGTTVTTPGGITTTIPSGSPLTPPNATGGAVSTFPGSGGSGTSSPSLAAPSIPGGGGDSFAACMGFWDRETHMNKREYAAACRRTQNRLENLKAGLNAPAQPEPRAAKSDRRSRVSRAKSR
jgi:hypothetical protein